MDTKVFRMFWGQDRVATLVVFEDNSAVLRWRTEHPGTVVYEKAEDAFYVHGKGGLGRGEFVQVS